MYNHNASVRDSSLRIDHWSCNKRWDCGTTASFSEGRWCREYKSIETIPTTGSRKSKVLCHRVPLLWCHLRSQLGANPGIAGFDSEHLFKNSNVAAAIFVKTFSRIRTQKITDWDTTFLDFLLTVSLSSPKPMTLYYGKIKSTKRKSVHICLIGWLINEKSGCLCLRNSVLIYESLRHCKEAHWTI